MLDVDGAHLIDAAHPIILQPVVAPLLEHDESAISKDFKLAISFGGLV